MTSEYNKVFSARRQFAVGLKGNQVKILSDPVTVNGETGCNAIVRKHEKAQPHVDDPQVRKPAENEGA